MKKKYMYRSFVEITKKILKILKSNFWPLTDLFFNIRPLFTVNYPWHKHTVTGRNTVEDELIEC